MRQYKKVHYTLWREKATHNDSLGDGDTGERVLGSDQAQSIVHPDFGFSQSIDDIFPMLPSFQILSDSCSTDQLMENMYSIFQTMEKEWRERVI